MRLALAAAAVTLALGFGLPVHPAAEHNTTAMPRHLAQAAGAVAADLLRFR